MLRKKKDTLKTIHKKIKYKMNNVNYINTSKRKRNEQLSKNKKYKEVMCA